MRPCDGKETGSGIRCGIGDFDWLNGPHQNVPTDDVRGVRGVSLGVSTSVVVMIVKISFGIHETDCDGATLYRRTRPRSPASPPGGPDDFLKSSSFANL
jgi:hypothetical protein